MLHWNGVVVGDFAAPLHRHPRSSRLLFPMAMLSSRRALPGLVETVNRYRVRNME